MTWEFAAGLLTGIAASAMFAAGRGYEQARLLLAKRREDKPEQVPVP